MKTLLIITILSIFNISYAYDLQVACDRGNYKTCDLDLEQFIIGSIEPEDEEFALNSYLKFCKKRINQYVKAENVRNFKFQQPVASEDFCSNYDKVYDHSYGPGKPHIYYLKKPLSMSFPNRAKYYERDFSSPLSVSKKNNISEDEIYAGIQKAFESCNEFIKEQMKLNDVIFSYCDHGFRGVTYKSPSATTEPEQAKPGPLESFFSFIPIYSPPANDNGLKPTVTVTAYTIVNKKFTSNKELNFIPLRNETFFINGLEQKEPEKVENRNIVEKTSDALQKASDAIDTYNKFTQAFGRLLK